VAIKPALAFAKTKTLRLKLYMQIHLTLLSLSLQYLQVKSTTPLTGFSVVLGQRNVMTHCL